jgi:hypothetical protein
VISSPSSGKAPQEKNVRNRRKFHEAGYGGKILFKGKIREKIVPQQKTRRKTDDRWLLNKKIYISP